MPYPDILYVFNSNHFCIWHCFRVIGVFVISFVDRKWRHSDLSARCRRRLKVNSDSERPTTISYKWLIITFSLGGTVFELLAFLLYRLLTGNDVIAISPLGGVACQMFGRILNALPRYPISV